MDIQKFRGIVDGTPNEILAIREQPERLYEYVGLTFTGDYQLQLVTKKLNKNIEAAFTTGHLAASNLCRRLITDLIREHVILGASLEPYFGLLSRLRDSIRPKDNSSNGGDVEGDWVSAIRAARDSIEISNYPAMNIRASYARDFNVAESAKMLRSAGYAIRLEPGQLFFEDEAQISLVAEIERLIAAIGGLNIARAIFDVITPNYDHVMGRYHIVPPVSMAGGGNKQAPLGYILQLAVKHLDAQARPETHGASWQRLIELTSSYAAVIDVQPYYPVIWNTMDGKALLKYLQEQAVYDSMFRFLQLRASDVVKLCRGALSFLDPDTAIPSGGTLRQAFQVIGYLVDARRDARGPILVDEREVRKALPKIRREVIRAILRNMLSHSDEGPNRKFSLPTDAPTPADKSLGADFYLKPLIRRPGNQYLILDRSMCGWGFVEALMTAVRPLSNSVDQNVGVAMEKFVEKQFTSRGIEVHSGDYDWKGRHGECDIAVSTPQTLIFLELKKKPLTRRARAGSDAEIILDLAGSMLEAHAQAGWHELRITETGYLDLSRNGNTQRLSLNDRGIEKIALGMLDFGSFQDRSMLKQFMESTLSVNFGSSDSAYKNKFKKINEALDEIREQYNKAHAGKSEVNHPFFNCWFMSIPQLLILLDEVSDAATFRAALWSCRHLVTGTSDLYYEFSRMRHMKADVAKKTNPAVTGADG